MNFISSSEFSMNSMKKVAALLLWRRGNAGQIGSPVCMHDSRGMKWRQYADLND